ncbi:uncharacterized protein [Malus domestica]|uniref:uncharacterized protein n=1 Tax=Malus domestica TaxID=3750 RepID=UPI003976B236
MKQCREAIKAYGVSVCRPLDWAVNDSNGLLIKCAGKAAVPCQWKLYASFVGKGPTVRIKTFNPKHICVRDEHSKFATSSWLADRFDEELRSKPDMSVTGFMELVRKHYGIDITKNQVYKAKRIAKKVTEGSIDEQYAKLWDYLEELKVRNPGSTITVKTDFQGENPVFKRLYICFAALKKGFQEGCRSIVGFDGCHIKGPHPGQILSTVGVDANNGMFPIAFAVVEVENRETWTWFLEIFFEDMGIENGNAWTFITDKQKGLGDDIRSLMPAAEHRHCVRHLHNNFRSAGHTGLTLKQRLWAAARATNVPTYEAEIEVMNNQSDKAVKWLADKPPCHWSRSHFRTSVKCDLLLNNMCESFNSAILDARDKPIITMLQRIQKYLMLRMARLREAKWTQQVRPRILKIVEKNQMDGFNCFANYSGNGQYQVHTLLGSMFVVDLERHTCSCRKWQLCGIPCPHAISAIARKEASPQVFVHSLYKRPAYDRCYEGYIAPMPGKEQWKRTGLRPIKPPFYHKQPGRPKGKRTKAPDEIKKGPTKLRKYDVVMHCQTCGEEGHNKRRCPQRLLQSQQGFVPTKEETGAHHHSGAAPSQTRPQGTSKLHVYRGGRVNQVTRKANEMASQPQRVAKKPRPWRV